MRKNLDEDGARRLIAIIGAGTTKAGPGPWVGKGRCAEVDPELWFPGQWDSSRPAKKICEDCEVRIPCLEYALAADEKHGVWGGLSRADRVRLRRERMRGRGDGGQPGAA